MEDKLTGSAMQEVVSESGAAAAEPYLPPY